MARRSAMTDPSSGKGEKIMKTLIKLNPEARSSNIQRSLLDLLKKSSPQDECSLSTSCEWTPPVGVTESDKEYTLLADLPSVHRQDIHVILQEGFFELTGERNRSEETPDQSFNHPKSPVKFTCTFYLPENADPENMRAEFREGTLAVHIPKLQPSPPKLKKISIE